VVDGRLVGPLVDVAKRSGTRAVPLSVIGPGESVGEEAVRYVNRLSDFLFVAARAANDNGAGDVLWVPGQNR
jgi:cob(I)alamin adenosyltransferase